MQHKKDGRQQRAFLKVSWIRNIFSATNRTCSIWRRGEQNQHFVRDGLYSMDSSKLILKFEDRLSFVSLPVVLNLWDWCTNGLAKPWQRLIFIICCSYRSNNTYCKYFLNIVVFRDTAGKCKKYTFSRLKF